MNELIRNAFNRYYAPFSLMGFIKYADGSRVARREKADNRSEYTDVADSAAVDRWRLATAAKYTADPANVRIALTPERTSLQMVFIDDILGDEVDVMETVPGHLFVETSPGRWQVHFILEKPYSVAEAQSIQSQLRQQYGADPGASAGLQPRRHPLSCVSVAEALDRPLCTVKPLAVAMVATAAAGLRSHTAVSEKDLDAYRRRWDARYAKTGDASAADFVVAMACAEDRLSRDAMIAVLTAVSQDAGARKGRYAEAYFARTAERAAAVVDSRRSAQVR